MFRNRTVSKPVSTKFNRIFPVGNIFKNLFCISGNWLFVAGLINNDRGKICKRIIPSFLRAAKMEL